MEDPGPMTRKVIAFVNLYTEMGGGEYAVLNLVREMDQSRFHPIMVFNQQGTFVEKVRALGVETTLLPYQSVMLARLISPLVLWRTVRASSRMYAFMKEKRVDVIYCTDVLSLILVSLSVLRLRIPVVYSVIFFYEWTRMILFNLLALALVDRIVTNSNTVKRDLLRKTLMLGGKVETIYHGVNTSLFRPRRPGEANRLRQELRLPNDTTLVGMVGRFDPSKGHKIFLRAAARVLYRAGNVRFAIVGGLLNVQIVPSLRKYHDEVVELARELDFGDRLMFLEHRDDMPEVMRSFDVLVCPSVSEGFGLTVLEGLASGIPVVVSSSVGALEVVRDEPGVFTAEVADADSFADRILDALAYTADEATHGSEEPLHTLLTDLTWREYARRMEQLYSMVG